MGARIKELRASRGLKQQFLADHCGVTLRTFQMWQAGDTEPRQEQLEKLADILETTPRFILRGDTPQPFGGPTVADLDRRLSHIEDQLEELLGRKQQPVELTERTAEEALDYLKEATGVMQSVLGQLGRDVGRRDSQRPPKAGRSQSTRPAAA